MLHRKLRRVTSAEKTNRFKGKFEKDLIKKVTFGQRYERVMRYLGRRDLPGREKSLCKGPKVGLHVGCSRNIKESGVNRKGIMRGREVGGEVSEAVKEKANKQKLLMHCSYCRTLHMCRRALQGCEQRGRH